MTHDPLCPNIPEHWDTEQSILWHAKCECDLISLVREDERAKREADGPWFRSVVHECCERVQTERAAALRDAVEAVKAHIRSDLTTQEMFCGRKSDLVAAIEALGEGR